MLEKWYNREERVWTERRQQMNFQQLSNLQYWTSLFSSPWSIAINLFDILIVAYILYRFTKAIAGTKIMILVRGVVIFVLAQVVANILGLTTISWLINQIITYGVIAAVVIFSPEIRTGLERLGRATDFFSTTQISSEEQMIRSFVKSVEYMSPRKIGALLPFNEFGLCKNTSLQVFPWMPTFLLNFSLISLSPTLPYMMVL